MTECPVKTLVPGGLHKPLLIFTATLLFTHCTDQEVGLWIGSSNLSQIICGASGKNPPANAGGARDAGLTPSWEDPPGQGNGVTPVIVFLLWIHGDRGAWGAKQSMGSQAVADTTERLHTHTLSRYKWPRWDSVKTVFLQIQGL